MFRKVLIPHDGSAVAGAVLPIARTLARATGAQLVLLRVVPDELEAASHYLTEQTQQSLERIRREMAAPGLSVHTLVRQGDPANTSWM